MDPVISALIGEVKKTLATNAEDAMRFPREEPFFHGVQVGTYQGLRLSLDILESILRDDHEKERKS